MRIEHLSKRDVIMLNRCLELAKNSNCKQKHGALIYKGGRVLGVGYNTSRNEHPTMEIEANGYTTHAEIRAMIAVGDETQLKGATIYVARIGRSAPSLDSTPCINCADDIRAVGIKRVVVTL